MVVTIESPTNDEPGLGPSAKEWQSRLVDFIGSRRLEAPAIFFLEMVKPVTRWMEPSGPFFSPFVVPLLGSHTSSVVREVFASPERLEELIQEIQRATESRDKGRCDVCN